MASKSAGSPAALPTVTDRRGLLRPSRRPTPRTGSRVSCPRTPSFPEPVARPVVRPSWGPAGAQRLARSCGPQHDPAREKRRSVPAAPRSALGSGVLFVSPRAHLPFQILKRPLQEHSVQAVDFRFTSGFSLISGLFLLPTSEGGACPGLGRCCPCRCVLTAASPPGHGGARAVAPVCALGRTGWSGSEGPCRRVPQGPPGPAPSC